MAVPPCKVDTTMVPRAFPQVSARVALLAWRHAGCL